jgi:hypothetical protein
MAFWIGAMLRPLIGSLFALVRIGLYRLPDFAPARPDQGRISGVTECEGAVGKWGCGCVGGTAVWHGCRGRDRGSSEQQG